MRLPPCSEDDRELGGGDRSFLGAGLALLVHPDESRGGRSLGPRWALDEPLFEQRLRDWG
jgi:hypothetical protein